MGKAEVIFIFLFWGVARWGLSFATMSLGLWAVIRDDASDFGTVLAEGEF